MNAIDIVVVKKLIGRNVIEMLWNEDGVVNERELDYKKGVSNVHNYNCISMFVLFYFLIYFQNVVINKKLWGFIIIVVSIDR